MDVVKIFNNKSQIGLQCDINKWLKDNEHRYTLKQVSYLSIGTHSGNTLNEYSAMLWYSIKALGG